MLRREYISVLPLSPLQGFVVLPMRPIPPNSVLTMKTQNHLLASLDLTAASAPFTCIHCRVFSTVIVERTAEPLVSKSLACPS